MKRLFEKLSFRLRLFMRGRYGFDELSLALALLSLGLFIVYRLFRWWPLLAAAWLPFLVAVFRMCSKKLDARRRERDWFVNLRVRQQARSAERARRRADTAHRFLRCRQCGQTLRVPRKRGKIEVTCPRCGHKFITGT